MQIKLQDNLSWKSPAEVWLPIKKLPACYAPRKLRIEIQQSE